MSYIYRRYLQHMNLWISNIAPWTWIILVPLPPAYKSIGHVYDLPFSRELSYDFLYIAQITHVSMIFSYTWRLTLRHMV